MLTETITSLLCLPAWWFAAPMMERRRQERLLRARCAETRSLVLTYDDGPGPSLTPKLLRLLGSYGARATFFLAGFRAEENPAIADAIVAAGHEVGCHGQDHVHAWRCWPWRNLADVNLGYESLARWVRPDGFYRPPFGKMTPLTWTALRRRGAAIGWWTIAAGDVREELPPVTTGVVEATREGGGVVLLHDFDRGPEREAFVLRSTELLLDAAARYDWTVCTLGELLRPSPELRRAA